MRADQVTKSAIAWSRLTPPRRAAVPTFVALASFCVGGWLVAASFSAGEGTPNTSPREDGAAALELVVERREGGRIHDIVAFDGGTWVAHGTVVGRLVEAETDRLVLDPVIAFDDALPLHLAVAGGALAVVEHVPPRDGVPFHSRVTLWRPEDVAGGTPAGVLELGMSVESFEGLGNRLVAVGSVPGVEDGQVVVIDAGMPTTPVIDGSLAIDSLAVPPLIALGGTLLHVVVERFDDVSSRNEFHIAMFDVSEERPRPVQVHPMSDSAGFYGAVAAAPGRLLVISNVDNTVTLYDTSTPDLVPLTIIATHPAFTLNEVVGLALRNGRALALTADEGIVSFDPLLPIDPQVPVSPQRVCGYSSARGEGPWIVGDALHWLCDGLREHAVGAEGTTVLQTTRRHMDVNNSVAADARQACTSDSYLGPLCMAHGRGPLRLLVDPSSDVARRGSGPVALGGFGLLVGSQGVTPATVDVLDPDATDGVSLRGRLRDVPDHVGVAAGEGVGYLLLEASDFDQPSSILAIDARDPTRPTQAGLVPVPPGTRQVAAAAGHVVATGSTTLSIFNALDPLRLRATGTITTVGHFMNAAVSEGMAYVVISDIPSTAGRSSHAMAAIDITADAPRETWRLPLTTRPRAVAADGDHVFVADIERLRAFHIGGADPVEVASVPLPSYAVELAAGGGWVSVTLGGGGLWVVRLEGTSRADTFLPVGYAGAVR